MIQLLYVLSFVAIATTMTATVMQDHVMYRNDWGKQVSFCDSFVRSIGRSSDV